MPGRERGPPLDGELDMPAAGVDRSADEAPSWRAASTNFPPCPPRFEVVEGQGPPLMARPLSGEKDTFCMGAQGHEISSLGSIVLQQLLEVLPLRSKLTGVDSPSDLFPLPTSRDRFEGLWPDKSPRVLDWMGVHGDFAELLLGVVFWGRP